MEVGEALAQLGGVASRRQLLRGVSQHALAGAERRGEIARLARGRYALAGAAEADLAAARVGGTVACLSAAQAAGWPVLRPPDRPWVAVPRHRRAVDGRGVHVVYSDERETDPLRIVIQCARRLPFREGLAVADSALRSGQVDPDDLHTAAAALAGPGSRAARRVAAAASALKANPLESALHALVLEVDGLEVRPQVPIDLGGLTVHPDLVDPARRIVIEAEGWLYHGSDPRSFDRDVQRYTLLVVRGWRVLRFTHHQVVHDPDFVRRCVETVAQAGTTPAGQRHRAS